MLLIVRQSYKLADNAELDTAAAQVRREKHSIITDRSLASFPRNGKVRLQILTLAFERCGSTTTTTTNTNKHASKIK